MTDQEKHFEENNEHSKISEDHPNSVFVQNPPKENSLHSILLSVTFYLSIIYLVLFVSLFALSGYGWGFVVLIFLGPNLISLAIGAFLIRLGMKKGNKSLIYVSIGLYLLSIILAFDPDWEIFRIAPLCFGVLDLIGTLLVKEEKNY